MIVIAVLNIGLDIFFVAVIGLGVPGVALATIIAQIISSLLCLWKLSRMRAHFDFGFRFMRPIKRYVMTLVKLGLPAGLQGMLFSISNLLIQSSVNSFGVCCFFLWNV